MIFNMNEELLGMVLDIRRNSLGSGYELRFSKLLDPRDPTQRGVNVWDGLPLWELSALSVNTYAFLSAGFTHDRFKIHQVSDLQNPVKFMRYFYKAVESVSKPVNIPFLCDTTDAQRPEYWMQDVTYFQGRLHSNSRSDTRTALPSHRASVLCSCCNKEILWEEVNQQFYLQFICSIYSDFNMDSLKEKQVFPLEIPKEWAYGF